MEIRYQIKTYNAKKKTHEWSQPLTFDRIKKLISEKRIDGTEPIRVEGQEKEFGVVSSILNPPSPDEIVDIDDLDDDDFIYEDEPDASAEALQAYMRFAQQASGLAIAKPSKMALKPPAIPWYVNAFRSVGHLHAIAALVVFAFAILSLPGNITQIKLIAFGYMMLVAVSCLIGASFWYSWHFICCRLSESTYYLKRLNQ